MTKELQLQRHIDPSIAAMFNTTGKRIRMLRIGRGLTQLELAQALKDRGVEVNNTFISQIENSEPKANPKAPSVKMLAATADALGTTTDFLLLLTDDPSSSNPQPEAANA